MIGAQHSANFSIALVCVILWTTGASCNMDWFILHIYCFKPSYVTERPLVASSSDVVEESEGLTHVELIVDNEDGTQSVERIDATVQMGGNDQERSSSCSTSTTDNSQQRSRVLSSYNVQPERTAGSSLQPTQSRITAEMLSPLPVRRCSVAKRRAALGATVLTASPYKKTLEEKLEK